MTSSSDNRLFSDNNDNHPFLCKMFKPGQLVPASARYRIYPIKDAKEVPELIYLERDSKFPTRDDYGRGYYYIFVG